MKKVGAVLGGIAFLLAGCGQKAETTVKAAKAPEAVRVRTAVAQARTVERALAVTGSLLPDETVTVSAEVPGRVAAVYFDFGQQVKKGQVIAELEKQELTLQLERTRGTLAQAMTRLGLDPKQPETTPETTPMMRQAWNQMEDARSKYENAAKLVKTGDISQERFVEMEKMFRAREAAFEATRDEMRTLVAQMQPLRSDVKLAEKRLRDSTLRAPFDGEVSEKHVSVGQYIKENVAVVTLVKRNPMRLRVEIPESTVSQVRVGSTLEFTTDAAPGGVFKAVVRELNPSLDPKSRTLTAEARLTSTDSRLRPGVFVQVRLITAKSMQVVAIPGSAVFTIAGLNKVFTIENDKAVEHKIEDLVPVNGWVEIPEGTVKPGAVVAVSSVAMLSNGTPVTVTPATPAASGGKS